MALKERSRNKDGSLRKKRKDAGTHKAGSKASTKASTGRKNMSWKPKEGTKAVCLRGVSHAYAQINHKPKGINPSSGSKTNPIYGYTKTQSGKITEYKVIGVAHKGHNKSDEFYTSKAALKAANPGVPVVLASNVTYYRVGRKQNTATAAPGVARSRRDFARVNKGRQGPATNKSTKGAAKRNNVPGLTLEMGRNKRQAM